VTSRELDPPWGLALVRLVPSMLHDEERPAELRGHVARGSRLRAERSGHPGLL